MSPQRSVLAALLASLALPLALRADDGIVREFKRYFRRYDELPARVEAVLSLEGTESAEVVEVLVPLLEDDEPELVDAAVRVLSGFRTAAPVEALWAELEDASDDVLAGLLRVVARGRYAGAVPHVAPHLEDGSWEVRRLAARALSELGADEAAPLLRPLCGDGEVAVRCAALDGLAALRSELVVEPAIAALEDASWQVRASAARALGLVRRREAIEPLIERMAVEKGRLVADIGWALGEITGRDFGQRVEGWRQFWELYRDKFVVPTDAELERLRAVQAERRASYSPPEGAVSYHGIETPSRAVLFVIDVSGSMENEVVERDRFEGGGYPSMSRMDIVKTELQRTIEGLESHVRFNILAFATEVESWKKRLVPANVLNKSSAVDWAGRLEPIGGQSAQTLARAGLGRAANLEAGKTNTYGALMRALGVDEDARRPEYEVEVDTVFFLSDGRPSHGTFVEPHDILREVNEANALRKVVVHTIAIGEFRKAFMRSLAESNGGVFVDLGR